VQADDAGAGAGFANVGQGWVHGVPILFARRRGVIPERPRPLTVRPDRGKALAVRTMGQGTTTDQQDHCGRARHSLGMDTIAASREDACTMTTGALGRTIAIAVLALASAVVVSVASPSAMAPVVVRS
jgi:hypothetical protein